VFLLCLVAILGAVVWRTVPAGYRGYAIGGFLILWVIFFVRLRRQHRNAKPVTTKTRISADGIEMRAPEGEVRLSWNGISRHYESEKLFALADRTKSVLYIIPKRAFPDPQSIQWFASLLGEIKASAAADAASGQPIQAYPPQAPIAAPRDDQILIEPEYRYLDYLHYEVTSWEGRVLAMGGAALVMTAFVMAAMEPPSPRAAYSLGLVAIVMLPVDIIFVAMGPVIFSVAQWRRRRAHEPTRIVLGDDGVVLHMADGNVSVRWSAYRYYRETRRLILIWTGHRASALILPKRSFISPRDLERARSLVQSHLRQGQVIMT
jgi:hypothetical protein